MNILLIDNGTKLLEKLEHLLPGHDVVHTWRDFTEVDVKDADLIILSGGSAMQLVGNEAEFAREIELVRTTEKPVIGICFGCEIMAVAFGATLRELEVKHEGIKEIEILEEGAASTPRRVKVYEYHRWIIDQMPEGFEIVGRSKDGPELIRHTSKPLYGLQFHPENLVDQTDGRKLLLELLPKTLAG